MKIYLSIFICISSFVFYKLALAQSLKSSNVHYRIIDKKIEVFYDMPTNTDSVQVFLIFRKKSDFKFMLSPTFISGNVGIGVFSGKNNKIIWDYNKEKKSVLTGTGFYFQVIINKLPSWEQRRPSMNETK